MIFYQPGYYDAHQRQQAHQQAMLLHYAQQPFYGNGRSNGAGMSAFATGESVAAGTYLRGEWNRVGSQVLRWLMLQWNLMTDWEHQPQRENKVHRHHASASEQHDTYDESDDVSAFAEAYPAEPPTNDEPAVQRQEAQTNEVLPQSDSIPVVEDPEPEDALPVSGEAIQADPIAPAVPLAPLPPNKPNKVHVELDTSAVAESDEEDDEDQLVPPKKIGKNNGIGGQGQSQVPPYSFFPNIFSDASGATIAVANAYSNGKGGARSHAIAYGGSSKRGQNKNKKRFADVEWILQRWNANTMKNRCWICNFWWKRKM